MNSLKIGIVCLLAFCLCSATYNDILRSTSAKVPKANVKFKVRTDDGKFVTNALIGLAISKSNLSAGALTSSQRTNADGMADFGQIDSGLYFYQVDLAGDIVFHTEDTLKVDPGKNKDIVEEVIIHYN